MQYIYIYIAFTYTYTTSSYLARSHSLKLALSLSLSRSLSLALSLLSLSFSLSLSRSLALSLFSLSLPPPLCPYLCLSPSLPLSFTVWLGHSNECSLDDTFVINNLYPLLSSVCPVGTYGKARGMSVCSLCPFMTSTSAPMVYQDICVCMYVCV
jgi:hypothetical protein